jgi:Ca-activated chloride channel family protein
LRELANEGGGIYVQLSSTNSDIDALMSGEVDVGSSDGPDMATDQWKEEGQWLLLILLPLAALAFRRGLVICLAFFLVPMSEPAHALGWEDLWFNADQQGQKKFQEGEPADAAALFDDPKWQAASRYESGEFIDSAALFAEFDDASSLYNLGNAMAKQGEFEAALDAYEQSLEIEPDNEDAVYNRDLIAELKRQKDQQEGEQQEGQESDSESGGDSEQSDSENDSDQQNQEGASGESDSESQQSDSMRDQSEMNEEEMRAMQEELDRARAEAEEQQGEESEQPAMSEAEAEARRLAQEQTQAMEQWLRRVENDPGGLLRNKFRYQYQRKGVDQDGNSVWPDDNVEPW